MRKIIIQRFLSSMKSKITKIYLLSLIIAFLFSLSIVSLAQDQELPPARDLSNVLPAQTQEIPKIENPLGTLKFTDIYQRFIGGSLTFIGAAAFLIFIYGGVVWLTSAGNPEKIKTGKQTIVWAVIGLAFVFLSYAILRFILQIFTGATVR